MFYSNFLKKWVKTCERCNIALINWKTDVENVYIDKQNYWYNQFLKKYFIDCSIIPARWLFLFKISIKFSTSK